MGNSNQMAGALIIAFLIYITVRGQLPKYIDTLKVW